MKANTLLRNADAGANVAVSGGGAGSNAPSGTLSLDSGNTNDDGGDEGDSGDAPAIAAEPSGEKIQTSAAKAKEAKAAKSTVVKPIENGDEAIGDISDLTESDNSAEVIKKELEKPVDSGKSATKIDDKTPARDYTVFDKVPEIKAVVEKYKNKVPNEIFDTLVKVVKDVDAVKAEKVALTTQLDEASKGIVKLPESYIQHPDAWRFHPEVKQISANANLAKAQLQHYTEQLIKIDAGEDWETLTGIDENGNFKVETVLAKDTTKVHQLNIERILRERETELQGFNSKLGQLRTSHADSYKRIISEIDTTLKKHCSWLNDAKQLEQPLIVLNDKGEAAQSTIKMEMDKAINEIPPSLRNSPLAPVVQNLRVGLALLYSQHLALQSKQTQDKQIKSDAQRAEPVLQSKASGGGAKSDNGVIGSLDDMNE